MQTLLEFSHPTPLFEALSYGASLLDVFNGIAGQLVQRGVTRVIRPKQVERFFVLSGPNVSCLLKNRHRFWVSFLWEARVKTLSPGDSPTRQDIVDIDFERYNAGDQAQSQHRCNRDPDATIA